MINFILKEFFEVRICPRRCEVLVGMILHLCEFCLYNTCTSCNFLFKNVCNKCKCEYRYLLKLKYAHLLCFRFVIHLIYNALAPDILFHLKLLYSQFHFSYLKHAEGLVVSDNINLAFLSELKIDFN